MSSTMGRGGPEVDGEPAGQRLMRSIDHRLHPDVEPLTPRQVAVVLHALADHTALEAARVYSRRELGHLGTGPAREALWPTSTSIGRWLHDTAGHLEAGPTRATAHEHEWTYHQPATCGGTPVWTCNACPLWLTRNPSPPGGPVIVGTAEQPAHDGLCMHPYDGEGCTCGALPASGR